MGSKLSWRTGVRASGQPGRRIVDAPRMLSRAKVRGKAWENSLARVGVRASTGKEWCEDEGEGAVGGGDTGEYKGVGEGEGEGEGPCV